MKNKKANSEPSYESLNGLTKQECIDLLAVMCLGCTPYVIEGLLLKRIWSEYIPQNEDDLNVAKELFAQSGLNMKVRYMKFGNHWNRHPLLRSKIFFNFNAPMVSQNVSFMHHVENQSQELVKPANRDKWFELQDKLTSIRQELYQNEK